VTVEASVGSLFATIKMAMLNEKADEWFNNLQVNLP
jgi:hypothetical protein